MRFSISKLGITIFTFLIGVGFVYAQDLTVRGRITDESGEVLIGATIQATGSDAATITDENGSYELAVPRDVDELVISYLGNVHPRSLLEAKAIAGPNATVITLDITINLDIVLQEVVVSSFGIERERRSLGYSVSDLSSKEILDSQEKNVVRALSGKIPGIVVTSGSGVPGANAQVRIRGANSIGRNNNPLYVVDGVPIDNSTLGGSLGGTAGVAGSNRAIDLNPSDIADIQVLKSGAATALYGLRGANGVVLVTTKSGGRNEDSFNVNLSSNVGVSVQNGITPTQQLYAQGLSGTYSLPCGGCAFSWGAPVSTLAYDKSKTNRWDKNGAVVTNTGAAGLVPMTAYDNLNDFYRPGYSYDNTLSLNGSKRDVSYYFSLGYLNSNGMVPNSAFDRLSSKLNAEYRITPKFKTSIGITYANSVGSRIQQGSNTSGVNLGLLRTPPSFDNSNGHGRDGVNEESAYQFEDGSQRNYRAGGGYDNPFWIVNNAPTNDQTHRLIGKIEFNYFPVEWVSVTGRLGNDYYVNESTGAFAVGSRTDVVGSVNDVKLFSQDFNSDLIVQLDRPLTDDLNLTAILGHNYYEARARSTSLTGSGLGVATFFDVSNAQNVTGADGESHLRRHGAYFDLGLAYNNYLYVNVTGRNDWSSTLPEDNRSFFYPSVGLSFVASEVLSVPETILSQLKLRGSWAILGRDAPVQALNTPYLSVAGVLSTGDGWTNGISYPAFGYAASTLGNVQGSQDIKPESLTTIEGGVDASFLNNRLDLGVTYFTYISEDQILSLDIPRSTGFAARITNAGKLTSRGVELTLGGVPVRLSNGFTWDVRGMWYTYENDLQELPSGLTNIFLGGFTGAGSYVNIDQPYGVIRGGSWLRTDGGQLIINPETGLPIASGVTEELGDPNPDWLGSLRNTLSYKGLSLSFLLDVRMGGDIWNGTKGALTFFGASALTGDLRDKLAIIDGVTLKGGADENSRLDSDYEENKKVAVLDQDWFAGDGGGFGAVTETFVEDATSVRIRDISLSYSIPKRLLDPTRFIKSISISLTGSNVWLWTAYDGNSGLDPDTNLTNSAASNFAQNAIGLDYFQFPNAKSYSATINLGF